jgi:hypothetical protein
MALTLVTPVLAKQSFFKSAVITSGGAILGLATALFSYLMQQGRMPAGGPQLQIKSDGPLTDTESVFADVACTILGIAIFKPTATATYFKATDNATTSSDSGSEIRQKVAGANNSLLLAYPKGVAMANGVTCQGNTTATGGTGSGADGPVVTMILGAAE